MIALASGVAWAAPVRGTVTLPAELKSSRRHPGYWRLENGLVPIQPATFRGETVVVLQGLKAQIPAPKTVTVEIAGLQASQALVVVGAGSVVEIKNEDKVAHDLSIPDQPAVMPLQRLAPGGVRRQRFADVGGYLIRCAEYPHISISVVVVATPHFGLADDKGKFQIGDAPDGKAVLKVWSHGRWAHEETIDLSRPQDVQIKLGGSAKEAE